MQFEKDVSPQELKVLLHSKRCEVYYLEKCRVERRDGRVVYLTTADHQMAYYNIPIANTVVLLLGMGTSITQAAVRLLASAGVGVGFCGTDGTPLIAGDADVWMFPQCEYRPTKYMQGWVYFWADSEKRLEAARIFQQERIAYLKAIWRKDEELQEHGFDPDDDDIAAACQEFEQSLDSAKSTEELLLHEARFTKELYKAAVQRTEQEWFVRDQHGKDPVNALLTHGNYLAYGLGATSCWVLGLSHSFPVMHGKTRRGGLVFDIADLIKDILVLPFAFIYAEDGLSQRDFRSACIERFTAYKALNHMFDVVKMVALKWGCGNEKGADDHADNLYVKELEEGEGTDEDDS